MVVLPVTTIEKVYPDTYIPLHNCDEVFKGQYWWWR